MPPRGAAGREPGPSPRCLSPVSGRLSVCVSLGQGRWLRLAVPVIALLVVAGSAGMIKRERSPGEEFSMNSPHSDAPSTLADLRGEILRRRLIPKDSRLRAGTPRCVLFDWGVPGGAVTLVAFEDGTTSLYSDRGGGYLGMGGHETVRRAAQAFREEAARSFSTLKVTSDFGLPGPNFMAFFVVTDTDTFGSGPIPAAALQGGRHPLSHLGKLGNDVITEMRLVSEKLRASGR